VDLELLTQGEFLREGLHGGSDRIESSIAFASVYLSVNGTPLQSATAVGARRWLSVDGP
jgi:hypothetical protein